MRHFFYLHGFASSPAAGKARFFTARLAEHGHPLRCPDLNQPDFSTLTVSRMIGLVGDEIRALEPGPVVLIGSSLGGFVAVHLAERWAGSGADVARAASLRPIDRLVLLAPALDFAASHARRVGPVEMARWRATDHLDVYHHAHAATRTVGYALYDDARQYDTFGVSVDVPTLIFQGRRDTVVEPGVVTSFAAGRPNVSLRMLDDDHQLQGSLDEMWRETTRFLGLDHR